MRILLVDDEPDVLRLFGDYLEQVGHTIHLANGGAEGLEILRQAPLDIVITDLKMPRVDGFQVLREVQAISPGTEVIIVTGHGDIDDAVKAMREGASDFFTKPVRLRVLHSALERTKRFHLLRMEKERYQNRLDRLNAQAREQFGLDAIIGGSPGVRRVRDLIRQVCESNTTSVLIQGETGTGKELVASAVHYGSARMEGAFVAVNCTAIPEALAESELFGHAKGSFTGAHEARKGHFEMAHEGTVFLDEVGDLSQATQARLLRTLEKRYVRRVGDSKSIPVDIRVISATNKDLPAVISSGDFREDLYYRLNTFTIHVPPLRQRVEDIKPLARHFLTTYRQELRKPVQDFAEESFALLETHPFPGNIRELRNLVERAVILCNGERIMPAELQFDPVRTGSGRSAASLNLAENEENLIRQALQLTSGNRVQAAKIPGINRETLRRRVEDYNIEI